MTTDEKREIIDEVFLEMEGNAAIVEELTTASDPSQYSLPVVVYDSEHRPSGYAVIPAVVLAEMAKDEAMTEITDVQDAYIQASQDLADVIANINAYIENDVLHVVNKDGNDTTYRIPAAGFGTPTATIDNGTGIPSVTITASGPSTAKIFSFAFSNLKGPKGDSGTPFDLYRTYTSAVAMNADAANVPEGKFVMIATSDETSADNAKLYVKTSQGTFQLIADLDQAAYLVFQQWLNTYKPEVTAAITNADNAATNANAKATLAEQKAGLAQASADNCDAAVQNTYAAADYAYDKGNYARQQGNEAAQVDADLEGTILIVTNRKGGTKIVDVKGPQGEKGEGIDYSTMTPAEKDELTLQVIERINRDGGNCWYPVNMATLTPQSSFKKGSVLAINGVFYRATEDTRNFPIILVVQDGKFVANVVNGMYAYWVADPTLQPGWEYFTDASLSYWMYDYDQRLIALERRIEELEAQLNNN